MTAYAAAIDRDGNNQVITSTKAFKASTSVTFAAATTGAVGTGTLFTVTGDVLVTIFGVCTVDLTGGGSIKVGTANNDATFIPLTTGTAIDAGELWQSATPTLEAGAALANARPIANGADIIYMITSDTITAGAITFYCLWRPLSSDGNVVAA